MYSCKLPFEEYNFTSQIIDAQKNGNPLVFEPEWDVPDDLYNLVIKCLSTSPLDRPDFLGIITSLLSIAENYVSLQSVCERIRPKYSHRRLRNSAKTLMQQQLKSVDKKLERLKDKEKELIDSINSLKKELAITRELKKDIEEERERIESESKLKEGEKNED